MFNFKNISTIFILLLILITLTSACNSQQAVEDIIDIQWQWSALIESEPASQSINEHPGRLQYGEWFIFSRWNFPYARSWSFHTGFLW